MHERKLNRKPGYNYSTPSGYFVTINVKYQDKIFGKVENGEMKLNKYGKIADQCWREIPAHIENVAIGEYIIMPNHVHGIIHISHSKALLFSLSYGTGW